MSIMLSVQSWILWKLLPEIKQIVKNSSIFSIFKKPKEDKPSDEPKGPVRVSGFYGAGAEKANKEYEKKHGKYAGDPNA